MVFISPLSLFIEVLNRAIISKLALFLWLKTIFTTITTVLLIFSQSVSVNPDQPSTFLLVCITCSYQQLILSPLIFLKGKSKGPSNSSVSFPLYSCEQPSIIWYLWHPIIPVPFLNIYQDMNKVLMPSLCNESWLYSYLILLSVCSSGHWNTGKPYQLCALPLEVYLPLTGLFL